MSSKKTSRRKIYRKTSSRKVKFNMPFRNKLSNLDPNIIVLVASNLGMNDRGNLRLVVKSYTNVGL